MKNRKTVRCVGISDNSVVRSFSKTVSSDSAMSLTEDQKAVVALSSGRHLVLAPPGSGKTEMLSRRIINAVKRGVDPERMLCATFTNRAAFEMRDRVLRDGGEMKLPDVGNLHHFCYSFLLSAGRIHPGKHVLDEVQQEEFVKEVVDVLRQELSNGASRGSGQSSKLSVMRGVTGVCGPSADNGGRGLREVNPTRIRRLHDVLESYVADAFADERNPYAEILSGVAVVHQRRIGIPASLLRPLPPQLANLASEGLISGIERAYSGLKRRFHSLDFDDLINETYLHLEAHPIPEEHRFLWVQIDEVQDLSPLQWRIVQNIASSEGVCVYFGDVEQAIFSFLGATAESFSEATEDCERHYFRTNFRATPLLLEVLMRYSLDALASEWKFLPWPAFPEAENGVLEISTQELECGGCGINENFNFSPIISRVTEMLQSDTAENVAILVRTNKAADLCESWVKGLGLSYAKVSGIDLFSYAPMRDFMAFVSLFTEHVPMTAWVSLVRRFSRTVLTMSGARYFVRGMFASRWNPDLLLGDENPISLLSAMHSQAGQWAWRHRTALMNMRNALRPAWLEVKTRMAERMSFREMFDTFSRIALEGTQVYSAKELSPRCLVCGDGKEVEESYSEGVKIAKERIEKFLRYADHVYSDDRRPLVQILKEDWQKVSKLKEADLLVGDEKIVISTIHKAKGRQFDAVFIPDVKDVASNRFSDLDESRRLLYVAMSRARRHLLMWEADDPSVLPLRKCFERGYENYYVRRIRNGKMSEDWLADWERLAEMSRTRICTDDVVESFAKSEVTPVACMAMSVLCWSGDGTLRRRIYLDALENDKRDEVRRRTISCLVDCRMFGEEESARVRDVALRSGSSMVDLAALRYFSCMAEVSRSMAVDAIGDFVYSRFPEIRMSAVERLGRLGILRWERVVTGAKSDFERLGRTQDEEHEQSIRKILAVNPRPATYARRLRGLIAARALGFRAGHLSYPSHRRATE